MKKRLSFSIINIFSLAALSFWNAATQPTTISEWYGRLGNNINQLINVFTFAKKDTASIFIPSHPSSLLTNISNKTFSFGSNYLKPSIYYFDHTELNDKFDTLKDILLPMFSFSTPKAETQEKSIVIHLRNGDIWDADCYRPPCRPCSFHRSYIQAPIEYYQAILERHPDISTVVIIMDHRATPCPTLKQLLELLKKYNKNIVSYPQASLEDDFSSLALTQSILVHSMSSFSVAAGWINYVATQNSIQYYFKFIDNDQPSLQNFSASKEFYWVSPSNDFHSTTINECDRRINIICIGGEFGKKALSIKQNTSDKCPRPKVMELYKKPIIAKIYQREALTP